jgi:hypothetical protein
MEGEYMLEIIVSPGRARRRGSSWEAQRRRAIRDRVEAARPQPPAPFAGPGQRRLAQNTRPDEYCWPACDN